VGQCQAAVAEAVEAFGRIDVLLCAASEGTIDRLSPDTFS
jgi:NAD(P)-dependent dehydrogenase (short-subunit alcohol dehydrogenase family)